MPHDYDTPPRDSHTLWFPFGFLFIISSRAMPHRLPLPYSPRPISCGRDIVSLRAFSSLYSMENRQIRPVSFAARSLRLNFSRNALISIFCHSSEGWFTIAPLHKVATQRGPPLFRPRYMITAFFSIASRLCHKRRCCRFSIRFLFRTSYLSRD